MAAALRIQSVEDAYAVLEELERRAAIARRSLVDDNFPQQAAFIRDTVQFRAGLCTRRAGKSYGGGAWLMEPVMRESKVTTLYIAKTRDSAKRIMWRDVVKTINDNHELGFRPNETDLTLTNPANGSYLQLVGADQGPDEIKKFLGSKLRRVLIDEAADFRQDLNYIVYEILYPALADHGGEIGLIGTPGVVCKGLFYDVTRPEKELRKVGWNVHEWTSFDNPYMRKQIQKQIEELKRHNPRVEETPWFRRMYLREWVIETTRLCYKYDRTRNWRADLPPGDYAHVLGVDLGYEDESTFSLGAHRDHDPTFYVRDYGEAKGLDFTDVAERIKYYQRLYNPYAIVIDGANKQGVMEMRNRFGLHLENAEKLGKAAYIDLLSAEFTSGRAVLVGENTAPLEEEYGGLIWDETKLPKRVEHPACKNHGADATLYAWRKAYNYTAIAAPPPAKRRESVDDWEERQAELCQKQRETVLGIDVDDANPFGGGNPFKSHRTFLG